MIRLHCISLLVANLLSAAAWSAEGWTRPTLWADPENHWTSEADAIDASDATYACDQSARTGDGAWLHFTFAQPLDVRQLRVVADFGYGAVDAVQVDLCAAGVWTTAYQGSIVDATASYIDVNADAVSELRFRFHYLNDHWWFWLYDLAVYAVENGVADPYLFALHASPVSASSAALHAVVFDDGGAPCEVRFVWGADETYGNASAWSSGHQSDDVVSWFVRGLTPGVPCHWTAQTRRRAGEEPISWVNQILVPESPDPAWEGNWWPLEDWGDPSGRWSDAGAAIDGDPASAAHAVHGVGEAPWSTFLTFSCPEVAANGVRILAARNASIDRVDVDVLTDGIWTDIHEGEFSDGIPLDIFFAIREISGVRVRLRVATILVGLTWALHEVQVHRDLSPTIQLTDPASGGHVMAGTTVVLCASVSDPDPEDRVTGVTFALDGVVVGHVTAPPWQLPATLPWRTGSLEISATATDSYGLCRDTGPMRVHLILPGAQAGPFRWARKLFDPERPDPIAICRDVSVEEAWLHSGDADAGVIATEQWSGDNQAGGRSWAANTLVGENGRNYLVGLGPWSIGESPGLIAEGPFWPKYQQDAHLRLSFVAANGADLVVAHGRGFGLDGVFPWNAIVVELAFRQVVGGGVAWQLGWYHGSPLQVGVWQVPAGSTMQQAQGNEANRLSPLLILTETDPSQPVRAKLQVQVGGAWQVLFDLNGDGQVDADLVSGRDGSMSSNLTDVSEASGLLVSTVTAGGAAPGYVLRTAIDLAFRESPSEPIGPDRRDGRPLILELPAESYVSPVWALVRPWRARTVTVEADGSGSWQTVATMAGAGGVWYAPIDLATDRPTHVIATQVGAPPSTAEAEVAWQALDLYHDPQVSVMAGSTVLVTYLGGYTPGTPVWYDLDGNGGVDRQAAIGEAVAVACPASGMLVVGAYLDLDGNKTLTADEQVGTARITVTACRFPERIVSGIGFQRPVPVLVRGVSPSAFVFQSSSPADLEILGRVDDGDLVTVTIRTLTKVPAAIEVRDASTLALVQVQPVQGFTLVNSAADGMVFLARSDLGYGDTDASVTIDPPIPGLLVRLEMFAGRGCFNGGRKALALRSEDADPVTGAIPYAIWMPGEGATSYCMKTWASDPHGGLDVGSSAEADADPPPDGGGGDPPDEEPKVTSISVSNGDTVTLVFYKIYWRRQKSPAREYDIVPKSISETANGTGATYSLTLTGKKGFSQSRDGTADGDTQPEVKNMKFIGCDEGTVPIDYKVVLTLTGFGKTANCSVTVPEVHVTPDVIERSTSLVMEGTASPPFECSFQPAALIKGVVWAWRWKVKTPDHQDLRGQVSFQAADCQKTYVPCARYFAQAGQSEYDKKTYGTYLLWCHVSLPDSYPTDGGDSSNAQMGVGVVVGGSIARPEGVKGMPDLASDNGLFWVSGKGTLRAVLPTAADITYTPPATSRWYPKVTAHEVVHILQYEEMARNGYWDVDAIYASALAIAPTTNESALLAEVSALIRKENRRGDDRIDSTKLDRELEAHHFEYTYPPRFLHKTDAEIQKDRSRE